MNIAVTHVSSQTQEWIEWLARFGYAAKGAVYATVGALALQAAIDTGGQTSGKRGALQEIATQPFGQVLLGLVAFGLLGYVVWRFTQASVDPEDKGTDAKGLLTRVGYVVSGLAYAGLALVAIQIITGAGSGGGDNSTQDWTARLLAQPFGQWLVGGVGAIIIGVGLYQAYVAYSAKFHKQFKLHEMSNTEETWATRAGKLGFGARAVVYAMIGSFLIQAAVHANPNEAGGLGEALQTLARQPYGPWVLGIVALGLIAYGVFSIVQARYRQVFAA